MTVQAGLQAMKLQDLKAKKPNELLEFAEERGGRERLVHAQAGHDVRDPEGTGRAQCRDHRRRRARNPAGRVRLPAQPGIELPGRPRRHLCLALANPPLRPSHRRHGGRADPQPQGRGALFRAAEGLDHQFRRPRSGQAQGPFRQSDAALSDQALRAGARRPHRSRTRPGASSTSWRPWAWASAR